MKRKRYLWGILLGLMILLGCPALVSAASELPAKIYTASEGAWGKLSGNQWCYKLRKTKKKVTGWAQIGSKIYYFKKDGKMLTGWKSYKGRDYYFDGRYTGMVKGFFEDDENNLYYFDETGAAKKGSFTLNKKTYYANSRTHALARLIWTDKVGGRWYYYDGRGVQHSRWFTLGGKRYFCSASVGKMSPGWHRLSGQYYYFEKKGNVKVNQWIPSKDGKQLWFVNDEGEVEKKISKKKTTSDAYGEVIMVGDSRFFRTKQAGIGNENTYYISKYGEGLSWLKKTAFARIRDRVRTNARKTGADGEPFGKTAIVMNLGVNDLKNCAKYLSYVQTKLIPLAKTYKCDLYYVSVNPLDTEKYKNNKDRNGELVLKFNAALKKKYAKAASKVTYIDTYSYLTRRYGKDYSKITVDGLHYTTQVSQAIFNKIMQEIRPK